LITRSEGPHPQSAELLAGVAAEVGVVFAAILVFCLCPLLDIDLAGCCPYERKREICLDLASGMGFGSPLNPHRRVQIVLLLQCAKTLSSCFGCILKCF